MKAIEALRAIMEKNGIKFSILMDRLGLKSSALANRLSRENITIGRLVETVRALDYKIVMVPRDTRIGSDWYEIDQ